MGIFQPEELYQTDGGNYRKKVESAIAGGEDILELAGGSTQTRLSETDALA